MFNQAVYNILLEYHLSASAKAALVAKLYEYNLLPEEWRQRFTANVEELAILIPDSDFLRIPRIRQVFHESEIIQILEIFRNDVLLNFSSMIDDWEFNYDSSRESPEQYYEPLEDALRTFGEELQRYQIPDDLIHQTLSAIKDSIDHLNERYYEPDHDSDYEDYIESQERSSENSERSIFDDIDM